MAEYWKRPEQTTETLKNGWLHTGDIARADERGYKIKETVVGLPIRETVVEGRPTKKILGMIEQEKIDLLVMISYEEGLLEHWLFGHIKDRITRRMPCSVLLVRKEIGKDL